MGAWLIQNKAHPSVSDLSQNRTIGNFETVVPVGNPPSLVHLWRDNNDPNQPWHKDLISTSGPQASTIWGTEVAFFQSQYWGQLGNFEVFAPVSVPHYPSPPSGGSLAHWYYNNDAGTWSQGNVFWGLAEPQPGYSAQPGDPALGNAAVIQSCCISPRGNFVLLYPTLGWMDTLYRINDNVPTGAASANPADGNDSIYYPLAEPGYQWMSNWQDAQITNPDGAPPISGITLIQSTGMSVGNNFEALITTRRPDSKLYHCYRGSLDNSWSWGETQYDLPYEPVPLISAPQFPVIGSAAFIQSSGLNAGPGNFEAVVNINGKFLYHLWRDNSQGGPAATWHQGENLPVNKSGTGSSTIYGSPTMIQSNYGQVGNFELLVCVDGNLEHWWRNNDDPNLTWTQGNDGNAIIGDVNIGSIQ